MSTDPVKAAEQAALASLRKEKVTVLGWLGKNWYWLVAIALVAGLSFVLAKIR